MLAGCTIDDPVVISRRWDIAGPDEQFNRALLVLWDNGEIREEVVTLVEWRACSPHWRWDGERCWLPGAEGKWRPPR